MQELVFFWGCWIGSRGFGEVHICFLVLNLELVPPFAQYATLNRKTAVVKVDLIFNTLPSFPMEAQREFIEQVDTEIHTTPKPAS